jgi:hypothetical protein
MNSCAIFSLSERLFITESTHWVDCGVEGLGIVADAFAPISSESAITKIVTEFLKKGEVVIYRGKLSLRFSFNVFLQKSSKYSTWQLSFIPYFSILGEQLDIDDE